MKSALGRYINVVGHSNEREDQTVSTFDGKVLFALTALILLGPYLPFLSLTRFVGIGIFGSGVEARLDNLALPLVGLYFIGRSLVSSKLILPIHLIMYVAFLLWVAFVTLIWWSNMPAEFDGQNARGVGLLRAIDAYGRPAAVLLIAANVRITRRDFTLLIRLILGVGLLLGVIAAGQLLETTNGPVNKFLFAYYDNHSGNHFWMVLNQGRVAALMPQLSTLGMYVVLALGLLVAQVIGGRSISSAWIYGVLVGGVFLAGILSGSKVFVGGTGMLAVGMILFLRSVRRESIRKIIVGTLAILLVSFASFQIFPQQTKGIVGLAIPRPTEVTVNDSIDSLTSDQLIELDNQLVTGVIDPDSASTRAMIDRLAGSGDPISPTELVDGVLDLTGQDTRSALLELAEIGGDLTFDTTSQRTESEDRIARMLSLSVASREYQLIELDNQLAAGVIDADEYQKIRDRILYNPLRPTEKSFVENLYPSSLYDRYLRRFYTVYLASRFDTTDGKVFRTGATDIAADYPLTGLGLNVVNRTTDSMALGIFIMGGLVGSLLYLATLLVLTLNLLRIVRRRDDLESAAIATVLLILTGAFLVMSIGFHTLIQDRAGDAYWLIVGLVLGPLAFQNQHEYPTESR